MESSPLIAQSIYDSSNLNPTQPRQLNMQDNARAATILSSSNQTISASTSLSALGSNTNSATAPAPAPPSSTSNSSNQEYGVKLDQLDPSVAAAVAAWPMREFGSVQIPISFEQPSPEQLIQQQMLSQSRSLIMQNMAVRDMASAEATTNNAILRNFT
ncbi:hypothetical protein BGX28_010233, partial [Mortierella sp. GBA30]